MGKLVRLELFNFKSYKGHHVLLFGDSYFTSIIGPNGSGKSNSMDAISFVLGIKSSQLRSSQLRDLVYRGRVLKHATINEDGSATAVAEPGRQPVSTDEAQERNDPKSAWVMAVYEDDAGDEMTWKRTINSQGSSEYRINNKAVNAQQYNQALESENILIKARNFLVFQGDVEAIASQSPRDLTRLLEQISGSIDFKPEYERLKEAQEMAFENQNYSLNKRRGINSEIKQYQEQKREADTYSRKLEQRDQAVVKHVLWKLYLLQQVIERSQTEIHKQQEELQDHRRGLSQHEEDLHGARREHEKSERDSDKNHRAIKAKEREILEKENSIVPIAEKISYLKETQINVGGRIVVLDKQKSAKDEALSKLQKDIDLVGKAQSRWEASWREEGQQQGRILNENDLSEYNKLKETATNRLSERQAEADSLMRQVRADKETLHSLKSALDTAEYRQKRSETELEKSRTDRQANFELSEEIKGEISAKRKQTNTLVSSRRRNVQTRNELEEKLQECLSRLLDAEDGRQQSHKEAQMKALISDMKRIFPGVRARVGDLCKPKQKKYSDAVVTVLGRNFDSVIVDDEKTAKECMQYLRDQRRGQATFIPLDTIQVKPVNSNLKGLHKGTRMAIDVLEYDKSLDRAMSYACGNAVICDDLATAKFICFEKGIEAKAVTLDGTIIHKGGLMTGGRGKEQTARRFEDAELDNLRKFAEDLRLQLQTLPDIRRHVSEEERLQGDLTSLDQRLREALEDEESLRRNIESAEKRILQYRTEQDSMQTTHQERNQRLQHLVQRLEALQSTISEVEDQIFADFCQRLGFSNIRQYESSQGSIQQEAQERRLEYQHQNARLHARLTREEQEASELGGRIEGLKARLKSVDVELTRFEAESQSLSEASDQLSVQLHELNERLQRRQTVVDKKAEIVMQHKREVQKRNREVEGAIRNINESKADLDRGFVERYGLLRRCKLENIDIPLKAHSKGLDQLPIQTFAQTSDAMDVDTEADADVEPDQINTYDHGIDIDFDIVEDLSVSGSKSVEDDLLAKISAVDEELRSMAPNMRAIERLEGVESRLKSTEKEFEEARKRAKEAKDDFQEVREKRLRLFRRAFNHISEQIDPIYKELTRSTATPMGGQAYLDQEDSDEPYLDGIRYHAMPPLKRFRDMEHLSGGEKTIAALALLFAVHSYQPSPFFVLDEVDAALDNANVARIGNYIKQHAGPGMQFIVISLKTSLFQTSEALIGIHRDQTTNTSKALTLDLRKYR